MHPEFGSKPDVTPDHERISNCDTPSSLTSAIEDMFEKALTRPEEAEAYATLVAALQNKSVGDVRLRTVVIKKCQFEFELIYPTANNNNNNPSAAAEEEAGYFDVRGSSLEEIKARRTEVAIRKFHRRQRALGNVRFIAEIYNNGLLCVQILHGVIGTLLDAGTDQSLAELAVLLVTSGKKIEGETKDLIKSGKKDSRVHPMEAIIERIQVIMSQGRHTCYTSKGLQNVLDLRKDGWVPPLHN